MLSPSKNLFVSIPAESEEQVLHPGTVVSVEDKIYTAELEEKDLLTKSGQEVLIYYEVERTFMKELAWIENVIQDHPKPTISFGTSGKPICAESRACYRVPLATKNLTANVGLEEGCKLLEVSQAGFAIIASHLLPKGKLIEATLCYGHGEFSGRARVQSVKELGHGRRRYGFCCVDKKMAHGSLPRGLHVISMAVQRDHLRGSRR